MKKFYTLTLVACVAVMGCASAAPKELVSAREAYRRASSGPAGRMAPAEVHVAQQALQKAEQSFANEPDSYKTKDLAYVAERKAQVAEATASIISEKEGQAAAGSEYSATQGKIASKTQSDLAQSQSDLAASKQEGAMSAERLAAEQKARAEAEQRAADAQAALAKLAAVKEEPRGMVITLSGSVLFASNQTALLPAAQSRLDQVAAVLLTTRERNVTVEGHTDSQGADSRNMDLSQRRAASVRDYLVQKGYGADLITANGLGESRPVAENTSAEGRANNRRVEIIIAPETASK
jgi:outer membrane protein OmpA-like peptidoglycan-associated protein